MRCQGAFLVSASKKEGKVRKVEILAEKGGAMRLQNPFGKNPFKTKFSWQGKIVTDGEILSIDFPVGGSAILTN
jgi:hypothetical protein